MGNERDVLGRGLGVQEQAGKAVEVRSCKLNETRWFLKQPHGTFVIYSPIGNAEAAILQSGKEDTRAIS